MTILGMGHERNERIYKGDSVAEAIEALEQTSYAYVVLVLETGTESLSMNEALEKLWDMMDGGNI